MSTIERFKEVEAPTSNFEPLPKGTYTAKCDSVVVNTVEEKIEWTFEVADGDYKGRKVYRNLPLEQDWALGELKKDINTLKLNADSVEKLEDFKTVLKPVVGKDLKIYVSQTVSKKNGKTYNNAYINGWFNEANGVPSVDKSDEIPF